MVWRCTGRIVPGRPGHHVPLLADVEAAPGIPKIHVAARPRQNTSITTCRSTVLAASVAGAFAVRQCREVGGKLGVKVRKRTSAASRRPNMAS